MSRERRVRVNLLVDTTHPALLEALVATDGAKRAERLRCLAAIGLAAERGQLQPTAGNGHDRSVDPGGMSVLDQLAWDAALLDDGAG